MVPSEKITISLPPEVLDRARESARHEGMSLSGYIARELHRSDLVEQRRTALAEYESEHGALTEAEKEATRRWAGR